MAPLKPHWIQPSHPELLAVHTALDPNSYSSSAYSLVSLPAGAIFAPLTFPPLTRSSKAYSSVQISRTEHIELNSDLVYVNHSCSPSLEFDIGKMEVRVARDREGGLKVGDELTFFYPSSEWDMAQPFSCTCGEDVCKGWITGAKHMGSKRLQGMWLNAFIEEMLDEEEEKEREKAMKEAAETLIRHVAANGVVNGVPNGTKKPLPQTNGLETPPLSLNGVDGGQEHLDGVNGANGTRHTASARKLAGEMGGDTPVGGASARELAGEMGGDTS
jgi:hypothetical protein